MSLKAFHIVFITASVLLCLGLSAWSIIAFLSTGNSTLIIAASAAFIVAVGLVLYEIRFLKKLKHVSLI